MALRRLELLFFIRRSNGSNGESDGNAAGCSAEAELGCPNITSVYERAVEFYACSLPVVYELICHIEVALPQECDFSLQQWQ